jgi:hypothetical protein
VLEQLEKPRTRQARLDSHFDTDDERGPQEGAVIIIISSSLLTNSPNRLSTFGNHLPWQRASIVIRPLTRAY